MISCLLFLLPWQNKRGEWLPSTTVKMTNENQQRDGDQGSSNTEQDASCTFGETYFSVLSPPHREYANLPINVRINALWKYCYRQLCKKGLPVGGARLSEIAVQRCWNRLVGKNWEFVWNNCQWWRMQDYYDELKHKLFKRHETRGQQLPSLFNKYLPASFNAPKNSESYVLVLVFILQIKVI